MAKLIFVIFMTASQRQKLEVKSIPSPATGTPGSLTGARTEDLFGRKQKDAFVEERVYLMSFDLF